MDYDRTDGEPARRPLALPAQGSRGPSYDAEVERSQAAFAAVHAAVGGRPILDTVGDLAALLALLPPEVPLVLDGPVRIAKQLSTAGDNPVFAVVASMATVASQPLSPVRDNHGHEFDVVEPALELSTQVLPTPDTPAAADTRAYYLPDRVAEALDDSETGEYLTLLGQLCTQFASELVKRASHYLPGGPTAEMASISDEFRGLATRLTAHAPLVEHLINDDGEDRDGERDGEMP
jgi:hypothetical protein